MNSLIKLEQELKRLESEILEYYDPETGEQQTDDEQIRAEMTLLNAQIEAKKENYVRILKDNFFQKIEEKIDDQINNLKREKEWVKRRKEAIEFLLHNAVASEPLEIKREDGKTELYVSKDFSVRSSVAVEKAPKDVGEYIITVSPELFNILTSNLSDEEYSSLKWKHKVNVGDLPANHSSIIKTIRPTVKITKSKPKNND